MDAVEILLYIFIGVLFAFFILKAPKTEVITIISEKEKPKMEASPMPYWVYYGQPNYWPYYLSSHWLYDVPYYGPITGGNYKPWGSNGHHMYRPAYWAGRGGGHSGVAIGGGGY